MRLKLGTCLSIITLVFLLAGCANKEIASPSGSWVLIEVQNQTFSIRNEDQLTRQYTITFEDSQRAHGHKACNRWQGTFALQGNKVLIPHVSQTKKLCRQRSDEQRKLYHSFPNALSQGATLSFEENKMKLEWDNGDYWLFSK